MQADSALIHNLKVTAYTVPTDLPEADGTIEWDSTTLILVEMEAGGKKGVGYTYAHVAAAQVIDKTLKSIVTGRDVMQLPSITEKMIRAIRNNGSCGIAMMAVSAVDNAMWDLKAKILDIPLALLLGNIKDEMLIYGSGGFTSYSNDQLARQLSGWVDMGILHVKMKIGADIEKDLERVCIARKAIGDKTWLYVDANGAYTAKQAIEMAYKFEDYQVTWFEEPVPADDLKGLKFIRDHVPAGMVIAGGEYGYNMPYFEAMLDSGAVDVLQGDATRCGGISGFLKTGHVCAAHQLPYSSHCAPAIHIHAALSLPAFFIAEYFHDHVRIENMLFDGMLKPVNGYLKPDLGRPGAGFDFKHKDATKYKVA